MYLVLWNTHFPHFLKIILILFTEFACVGEHHSVPVEVKWHDSGVSTMYVQGTECSYQSFWSHKTCIKKALGSNSVLADSYDL